MFWKPSEESISKRTNQNSVNAADRSSKTKAENGFNGFSMLGSKGLMSGLKREWWKALDSRSYRQCREEQM